jgi:hypothetical protein
VAKVDTGLAIATSGGSALSHRAGWTMANFETFHRSMLTLARDPAVTVHKDRFLSLNGSAFVALGSPDAVELLFDRDARTIGLEPTEATRPGCSFIRRASPSPNGPFLISAMAFMRYYGICPIRTLRWPADLVDGMLCIHLDEPALPAARTAVPRIAPKVSIVRDTDDEISLRESES